jgi:hypothetical protein
LVYFELCSSLGSALKVALTALFELPTKKAPAAAPAMMNSSRGAAFARIMKFPPASA